MKGRLIYIFVIVLFVFFVLNNINDGKELIKLLSEAAWNFAAAALVLQIIRLLITGVIYNKTLNFLGVNWRLKEVLPLTLASLSINIFAPFAPFPGSSIFIRKARKEGVPSLNIGASFFLITLFDYLALIPFLLISLYLQIVNHNIFVYEIIGISVFLLLTLTLFFILIFGIISPKIIKSLFSIFEKIVNKIHFLFRKRNLFIETWSAKND